MKIWVLTLALGIPWLSAQPMRRQTPQPPFPYRTEEVRLRSMAPGVMLACTLTTPEGEGPHPAIFLMTGSGPQDRDETVFGHKPFLVISDYLARRAVAVLRCDDRGAGKSTGRFLGAATADFSLDAEGAFRYLLKRFDATKVGIGGHSEGANIAAMVASRRKDVSFVVMLAGTGVSGEQLGYAQAAAIRRASGMPEDEIERHLIMMKALITLARTGASEGAMPRRARETFGSIPDAERIARLLSNPWHRAAVDFNPAPILTGVKCPILVLNGDLDLQVPADLNVPAIEAALRKGRNQRVTVRRFPNLNHMFQAATTGLPGEYHQIDETIAPIVLETIANWIQEVDK